MPTKKEAHTPGPWTAAELRKNATDLFMNSKFASNEEVLTECARMNAQAKSIDARNGVVDECPF